MADQRGRTPAVQPLLVAMGWDEPGGLNRYVVDLRAALRVAGVQTRTVVLGPATDPPADVHVAAEQDAPLPRRLRAVADQVERLAGPGTVLDVHFALYGLLPALRGRRPLVVHFHGPWAAEAAATGRRRLGVAAAQRSVERAVYRRASRLVVLSEAFARLLVQDYGVAPDRVRVVPPGVDLDAFRPGREEARARLGVPPEQRLVVSVRRLVPRMGLDVLLRAWARLPADPHRRLLLVGDGPERLALQGLVDELGLGDGVELLGTVTEGRLRDLQRSADLAVLPSRSLEGFGLAALESLASGVPVVVTRVGGLPEVVQDLDPGLVVPPEDPAALAARLQRALDGEVPSAQECRAHAERFTWQRAAQRNLEVYAEAQQEQELRVVYLDHCARWSGGEIALVRLLEALPGVRASVWLGESGPLERQLADRGVDARVLPLASGDLGREAVAPGRLPGRAVLDTGRYVLSLARALRRERPDLVHTNSLKAALYGSLAGRLAGVPVVWHARDRVAQDYLPAPAVRLVRAAARTLPRAVLANSRATLDTLRLPPRRRSLVVPDPYRPSRAPRTGAGAGPLTVTVLGRLAPWKGQDVALRAFAACPAAASARLVVAGTALFGEDDHAASLPRLAAELGIAGRVDLVGHVDDVEGLLARTDVLVHASVLAEPFGQVVVEGLAAGLPVVATRAGGPAEILTDGVDGLLVPPGDDAALAAALQRLLTSPDLRAALGAAALRRATDFAPERIAPSVLSLYRQVARRRRR